MVNYAYAFPNDQPNRNLGNAYGSINTYHLPTSNLPPEFRLASSSRLQLPQIQQLPHSQVFINYATYSVVRLWNIFIQIVDNNMACYALYN